MDYNENVINHNLQRLQYNLDKSLTIIHEYSWLINSYVLDFYVENHWSKCLPLSWKSAFASICPEDLCELFIKNDETINKSINMKHVWPLSILTMRALIKRLTINRISSNDYDNFTSLTLENIMPCYTHPKLKKLFSKHIKPKKKHEIERMAKVCASTARECRNVQYIVDVGGGLGHLSRQLAFGYGLNVCCLEQQEKLSFEAKEIDRNLLHVAGKHFSNETMQMMGKLVHLNLTLIDTMSVDEFLQKIMNSFMLSMDSKESFSFGIVGLHPCGDLAAILLKLFLNCNQAKFINIVGCCYMKLTCDRQSQFIGYPLSNYLINRNESVELSYEAREIACHAQESYLNRLETKNYDYLKVHSYRAAIEKIIVKHWPNLKHSGLRSIRHTNELTFLAYCQKAVENLNIEIPMNEIESIEVKNNLNMWKNVVIFYTMRLLLASLVETVLLNDRLLFLLENGCEAEIKPIFDPLISPRNHILTAKKCLKNN